MSDMDSVMTALEGWRAELAALRLEVAALREEVAPQEARTVPTVAAFVPEALAACSRATRTVYAPALEWAAVRIGDRSLDAITGQDLAVLVQQRIIEASADRRARDGRGAGEHLVGALRLLYHQAVLAGHVAVSPAADLHRPRRPRSTRRDLEATELAELFEVAVATSNDPALDELILWIARETAARRGGLLSLRVQDLDPRRGAVHLVEKNGDERDVPASCELVAALDSHARDRGARDPEDRVLRYSDGHPLTRRRIERLFARVHAELPWAAALGVSMHWIRHTTITDIERVAGIRVARAYAGHAPAEVTDRYTHVSWADLVEAHRRVFGGDGDA